MDAPMVVRTLDVPLPLHRLDGPTVSFQAGPQTGIGTRFRNVGKLDHESGVGPTDQHGIVGICPGMFGDVAEQFADETDNKCCRRVAQLRRFRTETNYLACVAVCRQIAPAGGDELVKFAELVDSGGPGDLHWRGVAVPRGGELVLMAVIRLCAVVLLDGCLVAFKRANGLSGMRQCIKGKAFDAGPCFPLLAVAYCELVIGHHSDVAQIVCCIVVQTLRDSGVGKQCLLPLQLALPFPVPADQRTDA